MPTIDSVVDAPVVSVDSKSSEALLARKARALEAQAQVDTIYDTKIERFYSEPAPLSIPLVGVSVALGLWALCVLLLPSRR